MTICEGCAAVKSPYPAPDNVSAAMVLDTMTYKTLRTLLGKHLDIIWRSDGWMFLFYHRNVMKEKIRDGAVQVRCKVSNGAIVVIDGHVTNRSR